MNKSSALTHAEKTSFSVALESLANFIETTKPGGKYNTTYYLRIAIRARVRLSIAVCLLSTCSQEKSLSSSRNRGHVKGQISFASFF